MSGVDQECQNFPETDQSQHYHSQRFSAVIDLLKTSSVNSSESQKLEAAQGSKSPLHTYVTNTTLVDKSSTLLDSTMSGAM